MQITARKPRFTPMNIKYAAAALGIVGALAAGVVTYTVTRDDSQASQPIAAAPVQAYYEEMAGENMLGGSPAVPAPSSLEQVRPAAREGFQATGPGDDLTNLPTDSRVPGATSRRDVTSYYSFGMGEGFTSGNYREDLSYLAPEVRSYAEALFLEQNGVYDLTTDDGAADAGMLQEEFAKHNPGANRSVQRRSGPAHGGRLQ